MTTSNKDLISRTLAKHMMSCIDEYRAIKNKSSIKFKTVKEFCEYHNFSHQNFMKILHRYEANPSEAMLVPQKRGPKFKTRRTDLKVEEMVKELRLMGNNRYEIRNILINSGVKVAPSPSTIYNICKRYGLNKLKKEQKEVKRRYLMSKIGELVHIDLHQLSKGITIAEPNQTYYLLGVLDDLSRACWLEVIPDKKALTVMFATLKAFNMLKSTYNIEIEAVMTDNGAEFGSGVHAKNKEEHPFERLLFEMQMKHRYTKPYRPQTNGKIERFWKTLKEDFIEDSLFNDIEDLKEELLGYIVYYNEHRPHSSLNGLTPKECMQKCN